LDYFATDEMLEPALMVVSDAIRHLRTAIRGGSVAANAVMYRYRASPYDREFSARRSPNRELHTQNAAPNFRPKSGPPPLAKYPIGTSWSFQTYNVCYKNDCSYDHSCCHCFSKLNGKESCPDNSS